MTDRRLGARLLVVLVTLTMVTSVVSPAVQPVASSSSPTTSEVSEETLDTETGLNTTQTPTSTEVTPGTTIQLTASFDASGYNAPALGLTLPEGWEIENYTTDGGTYRAESRQWLWLSGGEKTVQYAVSVPSNATPGLYDIVANASAIDPETDSYVTETVSTRVTVEPERSEIPSTTTIRSPVDRAHRSKAAVTVQYTARNVIDGRQVVWRYDENDWQPIDSESGSGSVTTDPLSEGTHTVAVGVRVQNGSVVAVSTREVVIDTTDPVLGIDAPTDAVSSERDVSVPVTVDEKNLKRAELTVRTPDGSVLDTLDITSRVADGATTVAFGELLRQTEGTLASGSYEVVVNATDRAGNSGRTTATVRVDTDAPTASELTVSGLATSDGTQYVDGDEVTVSGLVSDATGVQSVTIRVVSTQTAHVDETTVTPDAGSFSGTVELDDAPDGAYYVSVTLTDTAGNTRTTRLSDSEFVYDTEAPTAGVSVVAVNATRGRVSVTTDESLGETPTVYVTSPEGSVLSVPLSRVGANHYTGTFPLTTDGTYAARATVRDAAGNTETATSNTTVSTGISVDDRTATIQTDDGTYIELQLTTDDVQAALASLTSSETPLAALDTRLDGSQFIEAELGTRLSDNLTSAEIGIPRSEVVIPPGIPEDEFEIRRYNETTGEWEAVGVTKLTERTIDGETREYLTVTVNHFSTYGAVVVDSAPPEVTSVSTSPSSSGDRTFAYDTDRVVTTVSYTDAVSGINASSVRVLFDGTPVGDLSGVSATVTESQTTVTATGLVGSGQHTVTVVVTDEAGRTRKNRTTFTVEADTSPPLLRTAFTNGTVLAAGTEQTTVDVKFADALSGVDRQNVSVTLDGSPVDPSQVSIGPSSLSYTATGLAPEQTHTLTIRVSDEAGNTATLRRVFSVGQDTIAPTVESVSFTPTPDQTNPRLYTSRTEQVRVSLDLADSGTGIDADNVSIRFGPRGDLRTVTRQATISETSVSFTATDLAPGTAYEIIVTATDEAGNVRTIRRTFETETDRTDPQLLGTSLDVSTSGESPPVVPSGTDTVQVTFRVRDGQSGIDRDALRATVANATADVIEVIEGTDSGSGTTATVAVTDLQAGETYTVELSVADDGGNRITVTETFRVDEAGTSDGESGSSGGGGGSGGGSGGGGVPDVSRTGTSISNRDVTVGSSVTVTVNFENTGSVEGSRRVKVQIDGRTARAKTVNIGGESEKQATLSITPRRPGTKRVTLVVDGEVVESWEVTVDPAPTDTQTPPETPDEQTDTVSSTPTTSNSPTESASPTPSETASATPTATATPTVADTPEPSPTSDDATRSPTATVTTTSEEFPGFTSITALLALTLVGGTLHRRRS
jgi:hypothetical protein